MRRIANLLTALALGIALAACSSEGVSKQAVSHALLVAERVDTATNDDASAVGLIGIRDLIVHESQPLSGGVYEVRVTYTSIRPDNAIRRARWVFIEIGAKSPKLIAQCNAADTSSCRRIHDLLARSPR